MLPPTTLLSVQQSLTSEQLPVVLLSLALHWLGRDWGQAIDAVLPFSLKSSIERTW